jgi:NADPH:quinone reductase-like Zn-dependent oxidoreductase
VLVGVLTGIQGQIPTAALMGRQQTLHGITVGSIDNQKEMIDALGTLNLRPVIDSSFPLTESAPRFGIRRAGIILARSVSLPNLRATADNDPLS